MASIQILLATSLRKDFPILLNSIKSCLLQTWGGDYVVNIVLDSSDTSQRESFVLALQSEFSMPYLNRVRILDPGRSLGSLSAALNYGLQRIDCEIVVRHDDDDYMLENRVEVVHKLFEDNPNCSLTATSYYVGSRCLGGRESIIGRVVLPSNIDYKRSLIYGPPFAHPTIAFKRNVGSDVRYDESYEFAQDYKLYVDYLREFRVCTDSHPTQIYFQPGIDLAKRRAQLRFHQLCLISLLERFDFDASDIHDFCVRYISQDFLLLGPATGTADRIHDNIENIVGSL